jgi:hypothetical protein
MRCAPRHDERDANGERTLNASRGAVAALAALTALGLACGSARTSSTGLGMAPDGTPSATAAGAVTVQVASSETILGPNRFVVGLLDNSGAPIADATAHLTFYDLSSGQLQPKGETDAVFRAPAREAGLAETISVTLPNGQKKVQTNAPSDVGVYDTQFTFDKVGNWGVQAQGKLKNGTPYTARAGFVVKDKGETPAIGSPAPASHNLTVKDVTDLSQIDTSVNPSADMHTESIADGLAAGHAMLILFASPGYCTSRFCGPELELAKKLEPQYKGKVDFIHVEIYKDPAQRTPVDAVNEWHLPSEPWFFLVDDKGIVRAKFEGPTGMGELTDALNNLAG